MIEQIETQNELEADDQDRERLRSSDVVRGPVGFDDRFFSVLKERRQQWRDDLRKRQSLEQTYAGYGQILQWISHQDRDTEHTPEDSWDGTARIYLQAEKLRELILECAPSRLKEILDTLSEDLSSKT